jgi:hypothetical protein
MQLFDAHRQWAQRPPDERFWTVADMAAECQQYAHQSEQFPVAATDVAFTFHEFGMRPEVSISLRGRLAIDMTNYAFGQMARAVGAPPEYLAQMPSHVAAACLNESWAQRGSGIVERQLLVMDRGPMHQQLLRCATSDRYVRVWNHEIAKRLLSAEQDGWRVPPARPTGVGHVSGSRPATEADLIPGFGRLGQAVRVGDEIAPSGLYASDRDMFAFMVNPDVWIEAGTTRLIRGFFVRNSEVGAGALELTSFYLDDCCGNHIVWGAQNVQRLRYRHVGRIAERWDEAYRRVMEFGRSDSQADGTRVLMLKLRPLAGSLTDLEDLLHGRKRLLRRHQVLAAFRQALEHEHEHGCSPLSAWGFVAGLTRYSQTLPYSGERVALDMAGGRILSLAA